MNMNMTRTLSTPSLCRLAQLSLWVASLMETTGKYKSYRVDETQSNVFIRHCDGPATTGAANSTRATTTMTPSSTPTGGAAVTAVPVVGMLALAMLAF